MGAVNVDREFHKGDLDAVSVSHSCNKKKKMCFGYMIYDLPEMREGLPQHQHYIINTNYYQIKKEKKNDNRLL